ncbi:MAG: hypothetical protein KC618_02535, partial [Candidatus Omnitrophica bacterium]|nr:hypothetical protein [Candidatus Omnitrophota bacterium]
MRQSIEILLLPCAELELAIEQQVQDNPLLEYDEEQKKEEPLTPAEKYLLERFKGMSQGYKPQSFDTGEEEREEKTIANVNSLSDYLLQQLRLEINTPSDLQIGEFIIGDLNEDGYLKSSCAHIAEIFRAPLKKVERVLAIIQDFEPSGIAARDLKECLLNQARYRFNGSGQLVMKIIRENLDALSKKKYTAIARNCHISEDRVKELVQMIASLEPKPARNHQPVKGNIYVTPDITVYLDNEKNYQIRINQDFLPTLRINKT